MEKNNSSEEFEESNLSTLLPVKLNLARFLDLHWTFLNSRYYNYLMIIALSPIWYELWKKHISISLLFVWFLRSRALNKSIIFEVRWKPRLLNPCSFSYDSSSVNMNSRQHRNKYKKRDSAKLRKWKWEIKIIYSNLPFLWFPYYEVANTLKKLPEWDFPK